MTQSMNRSTHTWKSGDAGVFESELKWCGYCCTTRPVDDFNRRGKICKHCINAEKRMKTKKRRDTARRVRINNQRSV